MESEPGASADRPDIDPHGLLGTLSDVQGSAASESLWPRNPLWHGPLLAAMIWGWLAFSLEKTTPAGIVGLVVALIAFYFTGFQYGQRRRVRGVRPSRAVARRVTAMYAYTIAMLCVVLIGWGQTLYRSGDPRPGVVPILIGLVISSAFVTLGVMTTNALSRQWLARAR